MTLVQKSRWLKDRLQTMESAEIISRLAAASRYLVFRAALPALQGQAERTIVKSGCSYKLPDISAQLDTISRPVRQAILAAANAWLDHRASFFSLNDIRLGDSINWHQDCSSGLIAPVKYSAFINHREIARLGDVKYVWELNRLQHLALIALAWRWTGNATYLAEIKAQVSSWDKSNPFMMGLNWKSPLEAGLRLISWAYVYFLTATLQQTKEMYKNVLRQTIYHHQFFIRNFYSKHSSANNHLIGEMAGLYVASVLWPWYRHSGSWQSFSRQKLLEEIARQVETDGVAKERAIEYHIFDLELFLTAGALGQAAGDPFPEEYWRRVRGMVTFLSSISNRAGDLPMFGDGDSGQVVTIPETTAERTGRLVRIGDFSQPVGASDLRSLLLLWGQSREDIQIGQVLKPDCNIHAFPSGGYYVLANDRGGDNEILVVFDAGPLGLAPLNAHGHADALSFWFSYGGREFLVDPGTYCYYGSPEWRSYFRGTAAHNTIRIDGEDQSVAGGPFLWRQAAQAQLENMIDTADFVEVTASHDGYCRLQDPVTHRRTLRLFKKSHSLMLTDYLECHGKHDTELFFNFSEKCNVRQVGPAAFDVSNDNKKVCIRLDRSLKPELYRGCANPILGWVSRTFGVKQQTFTIVARSRVTGPTRFWTEISPV